MSNFRRNGPSAEYRPRDDGWSQRRDQYRENPSRNNPSWDPPSGETSREARRNDYSQPGTRNLSDYPSSGQYVPMSRRNQLDSDRRSNPRPASDGRSDSTYPPAAARRPPSGPRDRYADSRDGKADVERSRWRESRYDVAGTLNAEFERSRHREDGSESVRRNGSPRLPADSTTDSGLNGGGRRERANVGRTDLAEPPRKRSRRSPSYEAHDRKAIDRRKPKSSNGDRNLSKDADYDRAPVSGGRRSSIRDDRVEEPSRHRVEEPPRGSTHRKYDDSTGRDRVAGSDIVNRSRAEGTHRTSSRQENQNHQGRSSDTTRRGPYGRASNRDTSPSRSRNWERDPSPSRSRKDLEVTAAHSVRGEAQARFSRSTHDTRRSPTHSKRGRQRGRSTTVSSSDSERERSRRRRRYSRSTSSSSDAYRKRRRARSLSSPDSSQRDARKRRYARSPSSDHARRSPLRRSRSPTPSKGANSVPDDRASHFSSGIAFHHNQAVGGLSKTRTAPIKIALPHAEAKQIPTGPASTRSRPGSSQMPQRSGQPDLTPDRRRLRQDTVSEAFTLSATVPQAAAHPGGEYAELANSLQLQHTIYADLMASAGPEVRNVWSDLLHGKTGLTANVEQFWIRTMRQQPSPDQLQMLRVLQGQCMVIADLEKQMERLSEVEPSAEIERIEHQQEQPTTGWQSGSSNLTGKQPRDVLEDHGQGRHHLTAQGPKNNSQGTPFFREVDPSPAGPASQSSLEHRRTEDIAKAAKSKRREAKPALPYEKIAQVGEGTYGKVYKARNSEGVGLVALKRIRMEGEKDGFPVTAMREIKLLQGLDHVNVVKLHEMMISNGSVHMVMEYMDHDLSGILSQPQISLSVANLKSFCQQMLRGLAYLHRQAILHRDMKGSNILINSKGELKLADFGLARYYTKQKQNDYTNRVVTLWYRSPELLLGETMYDVCIDNWSAGCIMLELFVRKPVFQGNDEIHQLEAIYEIMGTPTEEEWPGLASMPWYELVKPKEVLPSRFDEFFGKRLNAAGAELAKGLLHYDPSKRLTADQALDSPFFSTEEPAPEIPIHIADIIGEWHEMEAKNERARRKQRET